VNCESCGAELHEIDNIIGRWCDPDCAEKGYECALCGLVPHRCQCSPEDLKKPSEATAANNTHYVQITYLQDEPRGKLCFFLKDVPSGPDKLPEVLRSIADAVEKDQRAQASEEEDDRPDPRDMDPGYGGTL